MTTLSDLAVQAEAIEHGWYVRLRVVGGSTGIKKYRPACKCGWQGVESVTERDAANQAFTHATLKPVEDLPKALKRKPEDAPPALFDVAPYGEKSWTRSKPHA